MIRFNRSFFALSLAGAGVLLLSACAGESDTSATGAGAGGLAAGDECVPIPDGYYAYQNEADQFTQVTFIEGATYTVRDGQIVLVTGEAAPQQAPAPQPANLTGQALADSIAGRFPAMGFDWMGLDIRGGIATLTGTAPSREAKLDGYRAGEDVIRDVADERIRIVVDAIAVEGGDAGVGAALAGLGDDLDLATCQAAFIETMQGRNIAFPEDSGAIDPVSAGLLDALTGIAIRCTEEAGLVIEIGGHTDVMGSADYNQTLSTQRAEAVRNYLVRKGVDGEALIAIGYGETQPLDLANTPEANARNRRTEFRLKRR